MRKITLHNKNSFKNYGLWRWVTSLPHTGSLTHTPMLSTSDFPTGEGGGRGRFSLFFLSFCIFFISCSKDSADDYADEHEVRYGVGFVDVWKEGDFNANKAKAVTRGELQRLDPPTIPNLYKVFVEATEIAAPSEKLNLTLVNKAKDGKLNQESVTEFDITPWKVITETNYTLYNYEARTVIPEDGFTDETNYNNVWGDGTIPLFGDKDYLSGTGDTHEELRVYFPLKHNTVLVRFILGVSSDVDAIRTIKLTSLKIYKSIGLGVDEKPTFDKTVEASVIASATPTAPDDELTALGREYVRFHVNPNSAELFETVDDKEVEKEWLRTVLIVAEYDVYDKNGQITRRGCTAQNTLALGFTSKEKGKYFDIYATVKPDFLYVLSDGDKEMADVVLR